MFTKFSPNPFLASQTYCNTFSDTIHNFLSTSPELLPAIQSIIIYSIIQKLQNRKSPVYDNISNYALKQLTLNCILCINKITNSVLNVCYFPKYRKKSIFCLISKLACNLNDPTNFRPISLLFSLSKVVERVIESQINDF